MINIERQRLKENAIKLIYDSTMFMMPNIKYIMVKKGKKNKYMIGIQEIVDKTNYIYISHHKKKLIKAEDIHYFNKDDEENFDICEEGFVLFHLNDGYELIYMDIGFHAKMWLFIDDFLPSISLHRIEIQKYLNFCRSTGINVTLLEELIEISLNNLYMEFPYSIDGVEVILEYQFQTSYVILFQHKDKFYLQDMNIINGKFNHEEEFTDITGAITTFFNYFYQQVQNFSTSFINQYFQTYKVQENEHDE